MLADKPPSKTHNKTIAAVSGSLKTRLYLHLRAAKQLPQFLANITLCLRRKSRETIVSSLRNLKGIGMLGLFKPKKDTSQVRILVVDDEADLVSTIQCYLEWRHCKVSTASNGREGLEKATSEKPDLILLDTNMPVMNGHQMLDCLRKNPDLKDIPVIMVTALCDSNDIATASSYNIADYITKPFDFTDLMEKITKALGNKTFEE